MPTDAILTWNHYKKGNPGAPGVEFELPVQSYRRYLEHYYRRHMGEELPPIDPTDLGRAIAEVNAGRWIWQCPACHAGVLVEPGEYVICFDCGDGGWHEVFFPLTRTEIEAELMKQPGHRLRAPIRNWEPGWTLEDLKDRTARANLLKAQGVKLVRALSIGSTRVWVDGERLTATNYNLYISDIGDDLAGRNGIIEAEDSLRVLAGSGNRFVGLPGGTTAQRTTSPSGGYLRWNTTIGAIDLYDGTAWRQVLDSAAITAANLIANGSVGTQSYQVAYGQHYHQITIAKYTLTYSSGASSSEWTTLDSVSFSVSGTATVRVDLTGFADQFSNNSNHPLSSYGIRAQVDGVTVASQNWSSYYSNGDTEISDLNNVVQVSGSTTVTLDYRSTVNVNNRRSLEWATVDIVVGSL